jgi:hypothetical protein
VLFDDFTVGTVEGDFDFLRTRPGQLRFHSVPNLVYDTFADLLVDVM